MTEYKVNLSFIEDDDKYNYEEIPKKNRSFDLYDDGKPSGVALFIGKIDKHGSSINLRLLRPLYKIIFYVDQEGDPLREWSYQIFDQLEDDVHYGIIACFRENADAIHYAVYPIEVLMADE